MKLVTPAPKESVPVAAPAPARGEPSPVERWWDELYRPANEFSIDYGDRYRSSYVLIATLAFLAIIAPAFGSLLPHRLQIFAEVLEIFALGGISALVLANHVYRWHERWISYRLLAELCRKQALLSTIGRSLPVSEVIRMSLDSVEEKESGEAAAEQEAAEASVKLPREAWVAWYFTAAVRAAPLLAGKLSAANALALAKAQALTDEQAGYHRGRSARNRAAGYRIGQLGELFFLLAAVVGGWKFFSLFKGETDEIGWTATLGACLSAASGAFVGIRAYSEFPLLVQQSVHMLRIMKEAKAELGAVDIDQPLASRDLGRIMQELSVAMMQDVGGWMQLFRIKALEAA
jgi:hypothetical protein